MKTYEIHGQKITGEELWLNVFGSGASYTWPWWVSFAYAPGTEIDVPGRVLVTAERESEQGHVYQVKTWVTLEGLVAAAEVVLGRYVYSVTRKPFELDNLDAESADVILQQAVLGEVIYG